MKKWTHILPLIGILTLLLSACGPDEEPIVPQPTLIPAGAVIAEGHLVPEKDLVLSFSVRGRVDEILVEKGDRVREGDILLRLADREQAEAAFAAAQLELTSAQQEYDALIRNEGFDRAGSWQAYMEAQVARASAEREWEALNLDDIEENIEDAETEVRDRKEDLDDAQEEFDKYEDLNEDNARRKDAEDDLEEAQEDYNEAVRDLEEETRERDTVRATLDQAQATEAEARFNFEKTLDGPDVEKLALLEARVSSAKAQVSSAESTLANFELKAPFDGVVLDINLTLNERVGPETWALIIADTRQWYVETSDLTELEVVDVGEGQKATIVSDALPDVEMTGIVEEISQTFKSQGGDILYTVRIKVDEIDPRMRWGMTVEVTFKALE